ncbi:AAA family ATPase [Candidatus Fokinia crypta]|nr:AAA family ATPase [Candidatus Fokinia cryptica]
MDRVPNAVLIEIERIYSLSVGLKISLLIFSGILKNKKAHTLDLTISYFLHNFRALFEKHDLDKLLNHPDLLILSGTYNDKHCSPKVMEGIFMEDVKKISNFISLAPYDKKKVIFIHDISTITTNAANALLKNIEDASPDTTIVITMSKRTTVPETILSRCVIFKFVSTSLKDARDSMDSEVFKKFEMIFNLCEGDLNFVNYAIMLLLEDCNAGYAGTVAKNIIFTMEIYSNEDTDFPKVLWKKAEILLNFLRNFISKVKIERILKEERMLKKTIVFFTHEILIEFSCKLFKNVETTTNFVLQMQNTTISKILNDYMTLLSLEHEDLDEHVMLYNTAHKCAKILEKLLSLRKNTP